MRDDWQPSDPAVGDVWVVALGVGAVVPVLGLGVSARWRVVWVVSTIRREDKCGPETETAAESMMPMETMVETMPSMESVVLVESVPSAASMMSVAVSMMPMRAMASVESMPSAMTVSSPVSTSGPGIIDNTRPAQQGEHRKQIAHKLVHALSTRGRSCRPARTFQLIRKLDRSLRLKCRPLWSGGAPVRTRGTSRPVLEDPIEGRGQCGTPIRQIEAEGLGQLRAVEAGVQGAAGRQRIVAGGDRQYPLDRH